MNLSTIKCGICKKVIEGFTDKQVSYLLKQHYLAKHPENLTIDYNKSEGYQDGKKQKE